MAELATGAVSTLLSVISNEAVRLGRVRGDVQFIQEEMESISSFLANLSTTRREHHDQVRTWMNQVRILANDCNNCIDLYLYRGNPDFHLARSGLRRYLGWASWLLRKLLAQHRAAGQLRELKERARDIGERRLRYGVKVKTELSTMAGAGLTSPALSLAATQDHEEEEKVAEDDDDDEEEDQDGGDPLKVALSMTTMSMDKEEYFKRRLENWIGPVVLAAEVDYFKERLGQVVPEAEVDYFKERLGQVVPATLKKRNPLPSIGFVVPETEDADALVSETQAVVKRAEEAHAPAHEDEAKDAGAPAREALDAANAHVERAEEVHAPVHDDEAMPPPSETKDAGAPAREALDAANAHVERAEKVHAPVHEDEAVPQPPETKDSGAPAREGLDAANAHVKQAEEVHAPVDEDKAMPPSPETEGKMCRALEEANFFSHFNRAEKLARALAHEDEAEALPPDAVDLACKELAVARAHFKQAHQDGAVLKMQIKWNVILVDVPAAVGFFLLPPPRPEDILYYILDELKHLKTQPQDQQGGDLFTRSIWAYFSRMDMIRDVKDMVGNMNVKEKIDEIKKNVCKVDPKDVKKLEKNVTDSEEKNTDKPLEQLLWMLVKFTAAAEKDQENKGMPTSAASYHDIIKKTAKKLKREIEGDSKEEAAEYEDILKEVFPRATTTTTATTNTSVEGEIKQIIHEVKDMLHELRELDREPTAQSREAAFEKTTEGKMKEIQTKIKEQLKIKKIVEKIKERLGDDERILVILKIDDKYVSKWDEVRHTLSLLQGFSAIAGAMIVANQQDKEDFCYARLRLIEYSLVGCYVDAVLQNTRQHMHDEESRHIVRDILYQCEPHELCMKIFAHALYTNRKRSSEELRKLCNILHSSATQKSLPSIARKMLKFSYRDLPKEYRSCLLYLAIFPQGHEMRRSTLIGRWVAEGLITTKDWLWSSSVDEAGKCFDTLVARCLVSPVDIGATGKVKSCKVDKLVYGFITKIAVKQRILETRLSRHLARHFSIFSDVHLRSSDDIEYYLKFVHKSSQFSKLKVLDLEGTRCFPNNQRYLRDICSKMLMLKYLSLRGTGVTYLTSQINNLHELEVLDIRETKIPESATRNVLLRKLKRLLAGHVDSSVLIPEKIEKMELVEVLYNVKPQVRQDLDDITKLEKLKKLGVVINKGSHLELLFKAICDLQSRVLRSLSITLDITKHTECLPLHITHTECLPLHIIKHTEPPISPEEELRTSPKVLESLSIIGSIPKCELLALFANDGIGNPLAKVTLSGTSLSQNDLKVLAKLPKLCCVRLRHIKDNDTKLIFNKDGFQTLKNLLVEGLNITEIRFDNGAASKLEKIILSSTTDIKSINGVECLQNLEELELMNIGKKMVCSLLANAKHIAKVTLCGTLLEQDDLLKQGDLQELAHKPKMRCLTLKNSYIDSELIFNKDEFQKLNLLCVYSSKITKIRFTGGSPKLEKIFWSFNNDIDSLSGIDKLPRLKELELNGDNVPKGVEEAIKKHKNRVDYIYRSKPLNKTKQQETQEKRMVLQDKGRRWMN